MKRRNDGFTLIEMMVVVTVLSLVWLSITCVLYSLYRANHRLGDDLQREHALDRFAMRLRLDARSANSAILRELAEGGNELVLSTSRETSIHYGISDDGIYRVVRQSEAVLHRDAFLVGRAASEWELRSPDAPNLIVVSLTFRDQRTQSNRTQQIKAAVSPTTGIAVKSAEASS